MAKPGQKELTYGWKLFLIALIIFLLIGPVLAASAPEQKSAQQSRLDWFREAKFGLFIHWGSIPRSGERSGPGNCYRYHGPNTRNTPGVSTR